MSILLSASTCAVGSEQGEHLFKVCDHSLHTGMGVGRYIHSSTFAVGGHNWRLRYYPDGSTEDSKDDIAVVLELLMNMGMKIDQLRVSCKISFFNWTTKRFSLLVAFTENISHPDYLISHTINRDDMKSAGYVVDDRFTLKCALTVIKEPYVIEDHIEVPPSDITEQLRKLLDAKEGADVTFEVQGEVFRAHKLVLAMRSPVFKALLYGPMREKDSNRFVIDDMQPAIFKVFLRFIYTDSLPPNMDDDLEGDDKKELAERKEKMSHGPVVTIVARDVAMVGLVDSSHLFLIGRAAMVRNTNAGDSLDLDHQVHSLAATDGAVDLHAGLGAAISLSR
ncbi:hypothetical protein QYE76_017491 [Lolium multiflorum]|uniref:Uncharacterized protein n=1 Tax=Lolium multiflorum TaxID=4521 RepID=A0AAD8QKA2_LOLMU|nr:hypothetical protein QYE76_017491 [Lolium multiflorum]